MADKPNFTILPKVAGKKNGRSMHAAHTPKARKKATATRARNLAAKKALAAQQANAGVPAVVGREIPLDQLRDIMKPDKVKPGPKPGSLTGRAAQAAQSQQAMDLLAEFGISVVTALLKRGIIK